MKKVENCKLISKTEIIDGIFDFVIESEDISKEAQCGQFLHINCGDSTFLRRPISICDAENGKVRFIFEVKGKGTEELAKKEVGDYIDVMGPLGHGFEIKDSEKCCYNRWRYWCISAIQIGKEYKCRCISRFQK